MMTNEEVLALFTEENRKVLNKAKQVMEKIYFKIGIENCDNSLASYLYNCLYDAMVEIEDIEVELVEPSPP